MSTAMLDVPCIPYNPRGSAAAIFPLQVPELVLSGPAGTGKSRALLEKVHLACLKHPNLRALMVRKTRRSLSESGMVTYWNKVVHPSDGVTWKSSDQQYQYRKGAVLAVGGLDKPQKVMSSEWDLIYVQEATELSENDWEALTTRLRNGKNSYQQLLGDCNPDTPTHWLRQRADTGRLLMLESRHEDNPLLFDEQGVLTAEGVRYLAVLDSLTGVRYARLRLGHWATSEGMVYENAWDRSHNMIDRSPVPQDYPRYLSIDFGYTNPFVCQWWAQDPDGRLIRYREIYKTKTLVEDHCQSIAVASGWYHLLPKSHPRYRQRPPDTADPLPRVIICDHDAEDRATFERHLGLYTTAAKKTVSDGIQAVSARLRPAGDGKPRLLFMRDALVERDMDLADRKKPTCFEEEIESYVWPQTSSGIVKEQPVKENDHACLIAGTMIATRRGDIPIEKIQAGDYVLTRQGYKRVKASGMTVQQAKVYTVTFSNGAVLTGTGNHPLYLREQGYIPLRAMRYGDIIEDIKPYLEQYTERYPLCQSVQQKKLKQSFTKESHSGAIQNRRTGLTRTTTDRTQSILDQVLRLFTWKSGKIPMGQCQRDVTFITKTEIPRIIRWKTWDASLPRPTRSTTLNIFQMSDESKLDCTWKKYARWPLHGINQKQEGHGIRPSVLWPIRTQNIKPIHASIAVGSFNQTTCALNMFASALPIVKRMPVGTQGLTTRHAHANGAENNLCAITTQDRSFALGSAIPNAYKEEKSGIAYIAGSRSLPRINTQKSTAQPHVLTITSITDRQPVYNLTVENPDGEGEYFANGVLVHNCDSTRYMVAHFDLQPGGVSYLPDIW